MINKTVWWKKALIVAVGVLLLEVVTYGLFGSPKKALTLLEVSGGGWEGPPPNFQWMCIESKTWQAMTPRQQKAVETRLRRKGIKLYKNRDGMPDENTIWSEEKEGERQWIGYAGGSKNNWSIESEWPFCFHARFGNSTGNQGGYWSEGVFIWIFGRWVKVWSGDTIMA